MTWLIGCMIALTAVRSVHDESTGLMAPAAGRLAGTRDGATPPARHTAHGRMLRCVGVRDGMPMVL